MRCWSVVARRAGAGAVLAVLLAAGVPVPPDEARAQRAGSAEEVTVTGRALVVLADAAPGATTAAPHREVVLDVGGVLLALPEGAPEPGAGADVVVTLEAPGGMSADGAVAAAARGEVDVLDVAPGSTGAAPAAARAAVPASGEHTLTLLPVHWDGPDATTAADFRDAAQESAAYWREQSGGTVTFAEVDVRDWVRVPAPATCRIDDDGILGLFNDALVAHGLWDGEGAAPDYSAQEHVAVYFPEYDDCRGWLGLATLGDGRIWLNGVPVRGVAGWRSFGATAEVLAHEMGHNFWLGHANRYECNGVALAPTGCVDHEYEDDADLMGFARGQDPGNLTTAFADVVGFGGVVGALPDAVLDVTLAPLGDIGATRGVRVPAGGTRFERDPALAYYVDFRPAVGRDARRPEWAGVQVHRLSRDHDDAPVAQLLTMNPRAGANGVAMVPGTRFSFPAPYAYTVVLDRVDAAGAHVRVIPPARFVDVTSTHPFHADIAWLGATGISTGFDSAGVAFYDPRSPVTREAMAAFLHRAAGLPDVELPDEPPFADVDPGHPFYEAITWLWVTGRSEGTPSADGPLFEPGRAISREAMAAFLHRAEGEPSFAMPERSPFRDVATTHPFYREIAWLAEAGIATGTVTDTGAWFAPGAPVSREAMAAFLFRSDARAR